MVPSTGMMFRETPPSYNFSWHNAPRRQYIVNLDADVEITVSSGETRVIRQGEVFFVEDTHGKLYVCSYMTLMLSFLEKCILAWYIQTLCILHIM